MGNVINPAHRRAAATCCRETDIDLFYAIRFLPKPLRGDAYTLFAVIHQIHDIFNAPAEEGGCCSSDSIEQRVRVAAAVMDYLYAGEVTGKDELDGFAELAERRALPRTIFDRTIEGIGDLHATPRFATWTRLHETLNRGYGSWALLAARVLDVKANDLQQAQIASIGVGLFVARIVCDPVASAVGENIPIPLDDLISCEVTDKHWRQWVDSRSTSGDEAAVAIINLQVDRIRALLTAGSKAMPAFRAAGADKAVATLIAITDRKLSDLQKPGSDPFAKPITTTAWQRFRSLCDTGTLLQNV